MKLNFRHSKRVGLTLLCFAAISFFFTNLTLISKSKLGETLSEKTDVSSPFTLRPDGPSSVKLARPNLVNKRIDVIGANSPNPLFDYKGYKEIDFTGDGVPDIVNCSTSKFVQIIDGKTRKPYWEWVGPTKSNGADQNLLLSGCDVVLLAPGHPAILLSSFWQIPGWYAAAPQFMIYKKGPNQIALRSIANTSTFGAYKATARSVQCTRYPQSLVNRGYTQGALCFYAAYESYGKTHTSLFKIDLNIAKEPIFRDITASSGLLWTGGARGTPSSDLIRSKKCSGKSTTDGLFMMSGTFQDFNKDGLVDIITVGQHASIRSHRMIFDATAAQGIRFETKAVHQAGKGATQEFLRVTSLDKFDPKVKASCSLVSGEMTDGGSCGGGMRDFILCFNRTQGAWERTDLPGPVSSEFFEPRSHLALDNKTIILGTRNKQNDGSFPVRYFRLFVQ